MNSAASCCFLALRLPERRPRRRRRPPYPLLPPPPLLLLLLPLLLLLLLLLPLLAGCWLNADFFMAFLKNACFISPAVPLPCPHAPVRVYGHWTYLIEYERAGLGPGIPLHPLLLPPKKLNS